MRALTTLFALLLSLGAQATTLKAHYGHYYATSYGDNTSTDITHLCSKQGVTGITYRVRWGDVELSDGNFTYADIDAVLATIAGMGAPSGGAPNNTCKLWIFPETKLFNGGPTNANGERQPCPTWLKAADGSPGFSPNTDSTSTVTLATGATAVTNASPIQITTSANHGYANGDVVFIDNVKGNTAANGRWVIGGVTPTTFTLTGSHGNGVRTSTTVSSVVHWFGKSTKGGIFTCKMWDSTVITKFKALMDAYGARYDGNANVEGFIFQESSLGLNNAYNQDSTTGGSYTGLAWTNAMISLIQYCGTTSFPTSRCMYFLNFIPGNQAGLYDVSAAISAMPNNQGCYSGPDILPANGTLVGTNIKPGTYQVLVRHVGCRSDSAQNTTIVGSNTGSAACDPTNCNSVFKFAVQGTFGSLGTSLPLPATDGLCINSYIFWNDSSAEQLKVDPTIKANPYGVGWYGQCTCGGAAP